MRKAFVGATIAALAVTSAKAQADDPGKGAQQVQGAAPVATTTTTAATSAAADPSIAAAPSRERDTVTLYQSVRPNRPWLVTGGAILVGSYATTAVLNATENVDKDLYIPVVGPWIHLADAPADESAGRTALIVGSGIVQGVGVLMTAASFFIPEKIAAARIQAGDVKLNITPTAYGRGGAGVGAVGTF